MIPFLTLSPEIHLYLRIQMHMSIIIFSFAYTVNQNMVDIHVCCFAYYAMLLIKMNFSCVGINVCIDIHKKRSE